jgi:oligopeptide transport system substrate-binding protein
MRFFLVVILLLQGCLSADRPLQFNLGIETVQLDWNRAIDSTSVVLLDNIMEGLTSYADSLQGAQAKLVRPLPALAASWSVSEEGRLYRFHLKAGVVWTDGVELEAQHFVDSWRRLLSPGSRSANAYHLFDIVNAQAFSEGQLEDFSEVGVRAVDRHTLEVRLRHQVPYFLHLVASSSTFPIRQDLIDKFGAQWTEPENLVTLGPYRIAKWLQGDRIILQASSSYRGGRPKISTVICRLIAEPLTAYALYENGFLDILPRDLPPSFVKGLHSSPDFRTGPKLQVSYLLFNTRRQPFHEAESRKAFIRALNRQQLAGHFRGTQAPTTSWIPPGLLGFREGVGIPAEGKGSDLLAGKTVEIRYSGSDTWNLVFQSVQRQAEEKLRMRVKLNALDSSEYGGLLALLSSPGRVRSETFPHILHLGWVADYPDSHNFMNLFTSTSENNYGRWMSQAYDQLVESAVATADEGLRSQLYLQAQRILLEEDAVVMPLFFTSHQALVRQNLKGVELNVLDKWYFRNISFESESWGGFGRSLFRRISGSRLGAAGA